MPKDAEPTLSLPQKLTNAAIDARPVTVSSLGTATEPSTTKTTVSAISAAPAATAESVVAPVISAQPAASDAGLDSVFDPLFGFNPPYPVQSPASWVALAAARRDYEKSSSLISPTAVVAAATTANQAPVISTTVLSSPSPSTGAVTGTVTATDPNGDKLTYKATTSSKGTVTITTVGVFTYTPTATARHASAKTGATAAATIDTVTVTVTDAKGASATAVVTVPILAANAAPTGKATVGTPIASTGVVTGTVTATDADKDVLSYSAPPNTGKGSITINATTGAFTYTPTATARHNAAAATADKTDTFTVAITDGYGASVAVPVKVTISSTNKIPVATSSASKPDPITGIVFGTINSSDADNDPLVFSATKPANGDVVVSANGTFTYTPTSAARANARLSTTAIADTFTITVDDGFGGTQNIKLTVAIAPIDTAPVVAVTVNAANTATGVVTGKIIATDAERDALTYVAGTTATSRGSVTISSQGDFVYTPTPAARSGAAKANTVVAAIYGFKSPDRIAVSPDGTKLYVLNAVTSTDTSGPLSFVSIVDTKTNQIIGKIPGFNLASAVAFSPDGTRVYIADWKPNLSGEIRVLSVSTNNLIATIPIRVNDIAVNPDGSKLYVTTGTTKVTAIDAATYKTVATADTEISLVARVAVSPNGEHVYVSSIGDSTGKGRLSIFNANNLSRESFIKGSDSGFAYPNDIVVSLDGSRVFFTAKDGTLQIVDTTSNKVTTKTVILPKGLNAPWALALKSDGSSLYLTNGKANSLSVIDAVTGAVSATITGIEYPADIAAAPDGSKMYVSNPSAGTVSVIDTANTDAFTVKVMDSYGALTTRIVSVPIITAST